ncbi:phosphoglucosamine mutase [Thermosipho sp. 1223]|nr:phosphoglucosamine mutase [Thermosipho sp. 1223]
MVKLFGTDGIRGVVNEFLTPELAFKLGNVLGNMVDKKIFIAKDTRASGDMLEEALVAGITSAGVDAYKCGILPTPALALITRIENAAGVMISASHNPPKYNGLKVLMKGYKLPDEIEERIEFEMKNIKYCNYKNIGRVINYSFAHEEYFEYIKKTYKGLDLQGIKLIVDVANGATYDLNPKILEFFGAKVEVINDQPDGFNINRECGSTHPEEVKKYITGGKISVLYDGDGDRCIFVDENGNEFHGDKILGVTALKLKREQRLANDTVVLTILSNMGVEEFLKNNKINTVRTKVGDRYVLEEMLKNNYVLGGERSGHIIYKDRNTTGDGLITTLEVLSYLVWQQSTLSELSKLVPDYPQVMINVEVKNKEVYKNKSVFDLMKETKNCRVIIRPSGTEPVIRILVEGPEFDEINHVANKFSNLIEKLDKE